MRLQHLDVREHQVGVLCCTAHVAICNDVYQGNGTGRAPVDFNAYPDSRSSETRLLNQIGFSLKSPKYPRAVRDSSNAIYFQKYPQVSATGCCFNSFVPRIIRGNCMRQLVVSFGPTFHVEIKVRCLNWRLISLRNYVSSEENFKAGTE